MIADVLKLHIQDKTHFITAYIKAYDEWLLYFIEKLGQTLSLNGNFKDLLNFIQNLENLPIALKIDKIKLYNTQGLKLKLDLMFKFVNL